MYIEDDKHDIEMFERVATNATLRCATSEVHENDNNSNNDDDNNDNNDIT